MSHTLSSHLPLRQSQRHSRRNSPYLGRRRRADEVTAVSAPSLLPTAQPLREEISNSLESRRGPVGGEELGWRLGLGGRRSSSMAGGARRRAARRRRAEKGCEAAARGDGLRGGVTDRLRASSAPPSASAPATAWATESASSAGLDHDRPTVQQAERRPGVDNLIAESSNIFPVGAAAQVRWRRREHRDELLSVIFCGESSRSGGGGHGRSPQFAISLLAGNICAFSHRPMSLC